MVKRIAERRECVCVCLVWIYKYNLIAWTNLNERLETIRTDAVHV